MYGERNCVWSLYINIRVEVRDMCKCMCVVNNCFGLF